MRCRIALDLHRTLENLSRDPDFTCLRTIAGLRFDLRYGTVANFMKRDVYGPFKEPFLHREAARMLARAAQLLQESHPGFGLLILDALRPRSIQRVLFEHVRGTDEESYVANPDRGSMHNFGCAVDLTVVNEKGAELDMGTGFDAFTPLSEPRREEEFLLQGQLTRLQLDNRLVLRRAMTGAGFRQLAHEWWHYDAFESERVRKTFRIVE